ncbi:hypothetical protein [Paenibacillus apis]|uniref:hypothetical protein n=1 Tax=Paenibacillus apis TaxID=1792174 RepID=UPI00265AB917|nr:hypothetical protein [Paenibacillus apis]
MLQTDEVAIYLKLVSRTDRQFLCLDCLGRKLGCEREALEKLIAYFRKSGNCVLFR